MQSATVNRVVAQEQLVFDMRRESFRTQIRALEQLEAFLEKEAVSLEKQLEVHGIEIASVKTEYDMVEKLLQKGADRGASETGARAEFGASRRRSAAAGLQPDAGSPRDQPDENRHRRS